MNYYTGENEREAYHEIEECEHEYNCNGIIDTEQDFYGHKELVEYECTKCGKIEQNWERE